MRHKLRIDFDINESVDIELDDTLAPSTVRGIMNNLPLKSVAKRWGEELYTDPLPLRVKEENARVLVSVGDVAYWPEGNALCLFFGPTPISASGEVRAYSPVNVIGRIITTANIARKIHDSSKIIIKLADQ